MSLNNIPLNNRLLSQLYTDTLLDTSVPHKHVQEIEPKVKVVEKVQADVTEPVVTPKPAPAAAPEQLKAPAAVAPPLAASATTLLPLEEPAPKYEASPVAMGNTPSLGGNKKGILIVVSNDAYPYLPDAELEFLSNILSACRLSIADVAIVNFHHYPQPYTELLKQFNSKQVLLMGVTPQQVDLPFNFPHFQLQNFDQRTYLCALPLGPISQNRDLKMQLWGCLKNMFGI
ncbi:hypothetical protein SAMN05444008_106248 [Cnuella takakiae]|uniref:DNA polymerase III, psi subunit n=1 Tax=Cnuella takakiae TaxID=1302690 RepID=A0A1M5AFZ0_9BACT|nr:hypothetical protein [Cnuella takakiae]OLY91977.1 hypothetical protein BUE76_08765 [Cnuella takakiae]SHF29181.1 hypothetical protein SAMN05444008_106248 [Cnuella takakiae]